MARLKCSVDGAQYHVMARTIQQLPLFKDPEIKEWIYKRVLEITSLYFVDLYAMAILDNHYHIILSVRKPEVDPTVLQERFERAHEGRNYPPKWYEWRARRWYKKLTDLSELMKQINEAIARYTNNKIGKTGQVWADRFKSTLIKDDPDLLARMAFVALSPVRTGLCERPGNYQWGSVGRHGDQAGAMNLPRLGSFGDLKSEFHQQAFCLLANHIADQAEHGEQGIFTCDLVELKALIERMEVLKIKGTGPLKSLFFLDFQNSSLILNLG